MSFPEDARPFPKLPFLLGDGALLTVAAIVGVRSPTPITPLAMLVIAACVGLGAVLAAIPFIVDYARRQNEELTERQNQIAALAQSTATSAEQLSIAAASLHGIAETSAKNLKIAEQLPQKLQEKIAGLNHQLSEGAVAENETLQQEVDALRASEAEKLESITTKIHHAATELARFDTTTQHHVAALHDALARLPALVDAAAQNLARTAATDASALRTAAVDAVDAREAAATRLLDDKLATALAEIEARLTRLTGQFDAHLDHATRTVESRLAPLADAVRQADEAATRVASTLTNLAPLADAVRLADEAAARVASTLANLRDAEGAARARAAVEDALPRPRRTPRAPRAEAASAEAAPDAAATEPAPPASPAEPASPLQGELLRISPLLERAAPALVADTPEVARGSVYRWIAGGAGTGAPSSGRTAAPTGEGVKTPPAPLSPPAPASTPATVPPIAAPAPDPAPPQASAPSPAEQPATTPAAPAAAAPAAAPAPAEAPAAPAPGRAAAGESPRPPSSLEAPPAASSAPVAPGQETPATPAPRLRRRAAVVAEEPAAPAPSAAPALPAAPVSSPTAAIPAVPLDAELPAEKAAATHAAAATDSAERERGADDPAEDETSGFEDEPVSDAEPLLADFFGENEMGSLTSDGFTRLVATAYIGIGNKLFIRGDGPGLSWEKGVPLQFVSIGKWRWETPDAAAPIRAKLYKNDELECTSVAEFTLAPGHLKELNATF